MNQVFLLNSHDKGDIVEKVVDVPEKAVSEVQATTSQVSSGSVVPQEKVKLAYKLLVVSNRTYRVLFYRSSSMY